MRSFRCSIFCLVFFSGAMFSFGSFSTLKAQNAVIHLDSTAQVIRGFGGANIVSWRPDLNDEDIEKAFGTEEGQLGLTILRIRIPPDKDQWSDNLPTAQKAYQMGVKVIASPWSPPASMKTNNDLIGGRLKEDSYADYASYLKQFEDYMNDNGVPLYAISIQNEPDIEVGYESCDWNAEEMTSFLSEHADSLSTKVIAPESFQFKREISDAILSDSAASSNVDIIGGHIYGGGLSRYYLPTQEGKEIWMTEYLKNQGATDQWEQLEDEVIWNETVDMLNTIQRSMTYDWNAYIWWYLKRYYSFLGDGEQGTEDGALLKRGYAYSHFSRTVRPGFHRLYTQLSYAPGYSNVSLTAYKDSTEVVVIAVNGENDPKEVNFTIEGGSVTTLSQFVTSLNENVSPKANVEVTNNSFALTLPAKSITTFTSDDLAVSNESISETPVAFELHQNYPNPFNPITVISFQLPVSSQVSLKVFDMLGREVSTLINGRISAGEQQVHFDASQLSSGMYIYRLQAGDFVQKRKMMLIK